MGAFGIMGNRAIGKAQNKHNQMQSQIGTRTHTYTHLKEDLNPTRAKLKFNIGRQ